MNLRFRGSQSFLDEVLIRQHTISARFLFTVYFIFFSLSCFHFVMLPAASLFHSKLFILLVSWYIFLIFFFFCSDHPPSPYIFFHYKKDKQFFCSVCWFLGIFYLLMFSNKDYRCYITFLCSIFMWNNISGCETKMILRFILIVLNAWLKTLIWFAMYVLIQLKQFCFF